MSYGRPRGGSRRFVFGLVAFLIALAVIAVIGGAVAWFWAARAEGPTLEIRQPGKFIGQEASLELRAVAPDGRFTRIDIEIEQKGQSYPVFTLEQPADTEGADQMYVMRPIGKRAIPQLESGPARIVARASRPLLYGLREAETTITRDVEVRLEPPSVAVLSTHHFVNHGGAEFVVYRASPADVESGVRVGDTVYPGFPASGAGIGGDTTTRVAFFALLTDQHISTPISLFARDAAGNEVTAPLEHRPFPKPAARSRIEVDDAFLRRAVPAIASQTPDLNVSTAAPDLLASYLTINRELRKRNNETIAALTAKTSPRMLWKEAFQQLGNSQVESRFADHRTYFYKGREIDQQVHLGFDLAVTARVPVSAAQRGTVVHAGYLGIYGNCVVLDHGLGVQSLYAHLSSIDVKVGAPVDRGQVLGRSGMTGLAGGDHLHFTMLVHGRPVNPVDWWDQKWMQDRVLRKIADAGGSGTP